MGKVDRVAHFMCENTGEVQQLIVADPALLRVDDHPAFGDRAGRFIGDLGTCDAEDIGRSTEEIFHYLTLSLGGGLHGIVDDVQAAAVIDKDKMWRGRGVTNVKK